jgi:hypothetical protein
MTISTLTANLTEAIVTRLAGREQERQLAELRALPGYRSGMPTVPDRPERRHTERPSYAAR